MLLSLGYAGGNGAARPYETSRAGARAYQPVCAQDCSFIRSFASSVITPFY